MINNTYGVRSTPFDREMGVGLPEKVQRGRNSPKAREDDGEGWRFLVLGWGKKRIDMN